MANKTFSSRKSQALVELAILGPLLIMCLGIVATYVAKLNNDQWELMRAFRYALNKAHDENKIISFGTWDDRRMVSVSTPILGEKTPSSGSGTVHWSVNSVKGESGEAPEGQTYVKVNAGAIPYLYEYEVDGGGVEPTYFTWKGSQVTINSKNEKTTSTRSGGVGEVMLYKIDNNVYVQGRGHGASRTYSGTTGSGGQ